MKRTASALSLVAICLIASVLILTSPVKAKETINLTIKSDGSIEPNTNLLERNGTIYTFTGDIFGTITVQTGYITIDGSGHTLEGNKQDPDEKGINLVGHDATYSAYHNVLVKNLRIYNFSTGIFTVGSNNNSFIGNYFDNAGIHIQGGDYVGNVIKHNIFSDSVIFEDYNRGGLDIITENNFINSYIFVDLATPPIVDKNYWNNYTAEYPYAKELNGSGIWDTPNVYDKVIGGSHGNYSCIDYHPLVNPIPDFEIPDFNIPIPTTTPNQTPTQTGSAGEIPIQTIAVILTVSSIASTIGFFVYLKKRNHQVSFSLICFHPQRELCLRSLFQSGSDAFPHRFTIVSPSVTVCDRVFALILKSIVT